LKVKKVVKLKTENIDSEKMLIHFKDSKGRKDRYTMFSETVLVFLGSIGNNIKQKNDFLKEQDKVCIYQQEKQRRF
jgi:site-specific recombinase XerD